MPTYPDISPAGVRRALLTRSEIALLDVRSESQFAQGHPLFAASFPLGQLEALATERLPRTDVPIVVYGDGAYHATDGSDPDAEAAAGRLRELGYRDVSLLAGGLDGWTDGGGEGVPVSSATSSPKALLAQMGWDVLVAAFARAVRPGSRGAATARGSPG